MNRKMKRLRTVHFVGMGGSGMSGIAEVMIGLGSVSYTHLRAHET